MAARPTNALRRMQATALTLGVALASLTSPVFALEELKGEKKAISACERQLCSMLVLREQKGPDLKCDLTKTWGRRTIKDAETSQLSWGFGDARCTVKLNVSRAEIVGAITAKEGKFRLSAQEVHCQVEEGGETKNVIVVVSPKIDLVEGRAEKIWVNLVSTHGPSSITSLVRFAIQLEDGLGLFHHALLKSVNGFINKSCPKVHAEAMADAARARAAKVVKKAQPAAAPPPEALKQAEPETPKSEPPAPEVEKKGE